MGAVDHAVVTHAHSDHARRGSKMYYCARSGEGLLRARLGKNIQVSAHEFGVPFMLGRVRVSFHPAGHILGSSQVRMECDGHVWVASGDYKREPDPTCEPFETVCCDVFVTEATFGTPGYQWPKGRDLGREIYEWWQKNRAEGLNSIVFAYSLGKGQRLLGLLAPFTREAIYCDPAMKELTRCYRNEGFQLAPTKCLAEVEEPLKGALILAPQSFLRSERASIAGEYRTALASGWMADGHHGYDHGFLLSDHADWPDLLRTIKESGARKVYVQHRGKGALVRHLNKIGIKAYPDSALVEKPALTEQMALWS